MSAGLARSRLLSYLAGMHPAQLNRLTTQSDIYAAARRRVEHALTELPIRGNYFWHQAATGRFNGEEVPPYLLRESFPLLQARTDRVTIVYGWLDNYLDSLSASSVQGFCLRDAFDWMDGSRARQTWQRLARTAAPGARLVLRSACCDTRLPAIARRAFTENLPLSRELTFADRSATHGSVLAVRRRSGE
jgi:S-adenosylmethionine:diacylglycerol 3-amino-3-carboxypropyl transferase